MNRVGRPNRWVIIFLLPYLGFVAGQRTGRIARLNSCTLLSLYNATVSEYKQLQVRPRGAAGVAAD